MQNVLEYINQFPPEYFLVGIFFLMLFTCMGMIPNHTDLTLFASAIIATNGKYPFFAVMGVIMLAMFIGENSMFLIGNKYGNRVFRFAFFKRVMPMEKRETFKKGFLLYPNRFLLALRMSPMFRPYLYLSVGALGLSHQTFFKYHLKWTLTYIISVYVLCFYGSKLLIEKLQAPPIYGIIAVLVIWILMLRWIKKGLNSVAA
jgi:membrane-associated protein